MINASSITKTQSTSGHKTVLTIDYHSELALSKTICTVTIESSNSKLIDSLESAVKSEINKLNKNPKK